MSCDCPFTIIIRVSNHCSHLLSYLILFLYYYHYYYASIQALFFFCCQITITVLLFYHYYYYRIWLLLLPKWSCFSLIHLLEITFFYFARIQSIIYYFSWNSCIGSFCNTLFTGQIIIHFCNALFTGEIVTRLYNILLALDRHHFDRVESNSSLDTLYSKIFGSNDMKDMKV